MPDLSACYFCGTALDEPLSEYPVVPKTLTPSPEQQRTVVLCSGCRRKLGRVVDSVLEAVDDRPIDETVQQDLDGVGTSAGDAGSADGGGAVPETFGERTEGTTEDAAESDDDATVADELDDDEPRDGGGDLSAGDDESSAAEDETEASASGAEIAETEQDAPLADDENGPTRAMDDAGGEPTKAPAADGQGEDDDDDGPHLSRLEYTKVMRLLENRDLPVDREEIRVVATNAYEIHPQEFDAIVDAAIDRGLIVEENGQFVALE